MLNLVANGPSGYNLTNSLRFRSSASAYLNRTFTTPTNNKIFTLSAWVKRGSDLGTQSEFFDAGTSNTNYVTFQFDSSNRLAIISEAPTLICQLRSTQVFRDPAAWYHIVLSVDTTQATASNRIKMYVNGNQITAFDTATYPTQNTNLLMNSAIAHYFAKNISGANYYDGYTTEINFIDGQALTPSSFGSTNSTTGVWQPAKYTGTYGTNGFYLNFSNIALTSGSNTGLGKDYSGNGNYWNTNNISVTSGVTYDAMTDVPTLTSATVANYCVMNPLDQAGGLLVTDGNLKTTANTGWDGARATFSLPSSGKYYWETTCISRSTGATVGLLSTTAVITGDLGAAATGYVYNSGDGQKYNNGSASAYGSTWGTNDVIGIAWDADTGTLTFYKNGTSQGTAWSSLSGTYSPAIGVNGSDSMAANFGQRPFTYTPPTGYVALNTYNLPTSTIVQGNKYMDATAYTGTNGSPTTQVISSNFQPDFLWFKKRSAAYDHALIDTTRGITKQLYSNLTNAEGTDSNVLTAIGASSFTVGNSNYSNYGTLVAWTWIANGGTTSSNTQGSITSTVQANTTAGFSVVTYTGTGANATVGHGLGVAPKMIIFKGRSTTFDWMVYHTSLGNTNYLRLSATNASAASISAFNNTSPTSTVFSLGDGSLGNQASATQVAYCWAEIAGFSKFGSYTGNGSTDGPLIYTGFTPKFILIKVSSAINGWLIYDTARNTYNYMDLQLYPNLSNAESQSSTYAIDALSNGFKIRNSNVVDNNNGDTYIYACFASNPFKNSLAR